MIPFLLAFLTNIIRSIGTFKTCIHFFQGGSTLADKAIRFNQKLPDDTPGIYRIKIIQWIRIFLGPGSYELYQSQSARAAATDAVKASYH